MAISNKTILKNRVIACLNTIETACKEMAKSWDKNSKSIPVSLYCEIILRSKWERHPTNKTANSYIDNFNKMIDLMETAAIKSAKSFNSEGISLNYISESIKILKDAFINGTKQK